VAALGSKVDFRTVVQASTATSKNHCFRGVSAPPQVSGQAAKPKGKQTA